MPRIFSGLSHTCSISLKCSGTFYANFPPQGRVTFQEKCRCGCVVNESSNTAGKRKNLVRYKTLSGLNPQLVYSYKKTVLVSQNCWRLRNLFECGSVKQASVVLDGYGWVPSWRSKEIFCIKFEKHSVGCICYFETYFYLWGWFCLIFQLILLIWLFIVFCLILS